MEYIAKSKYRNLARKNSNPARFIDKKRWLWLSGFSLSLISLTTFWFYFASGGNPVFMTIPLLYFFVAIPVLDEIVGRDTDNPPEDVAPEMSNDSFYANVVYSIIPAHFLLYFVGVWFIGTQSVPFWAAAVLAIGLGSVNAILIIIGHELSHKTDRRNRLISRIAFGLSGNGHFPIEHIRGHHVTASTPEDCASSRLGESVYAFALRELPGTFTGGWRHEIDRLRRRGLPIFHWRNEILQVYSAAIMITIGLTFMFGWVVLPFILTHHFFSWYTLTQANYIAHYGLLRKKLENGKYEPFQPRHSWNTNHRVSNLLLLHLQRHSDHHSNPTRPYQALRDDDDLPHLPFGYPGSLVLAAFPPLWFKVMDPRVLAWAGGDLSKVNICPRKKHRYAALRKQ